MLDFPKRSRYSFFLEAVRGILAGWVLISHLVPWMIYVQGLVSVPPFFIDLHTRLIVLFQSCSETHPAVLSFIVLSGYCIHRNGFRSDVVKIKDYLYRRFFRIFPIYFLAVCIGVVCFIINREVSGAIVETMSSTKKITIFSLLAKFCGLSVFLPQLHCQTMQGNAPLHTVMVECWLYVLYPLLCVVLNKCKEPFFWFILVSIWALGIILIGFKPGLLGWWNNGSLLGFLIYWWIGAKFADPKMACCNIFYWMAIVFVWLLLTVFLILWQEELILIVELRKLVFCLLFAMVLARCDDIDHICSRMLAYFGKPSYSLYAVHAPVAQLLIFQNISFAGCIFVCWAAAFLLYQAFEKPMTLFGKQCTKSYRCSIGFTQ